MINEDRLERLKELGFENDIEGLEGYVEKLQNSAAEGSPEVADDVYDVYFKLLKEIKSESKIVNRNWEKEDNELEDFDSLLRKYGMASITTIKDFNELNRFKDILSNLDEDITMVASIKENGHSIRAVYNYGELVSGTTRGRYKKGRDITRHLSLILPNFVDSWQDIEYVEVRGEALVSIDNFNEYLSDDLKTPLSAVTSIIRESASDEEIELLDIVCYKVLFSEETEIETLKEEFEHLEENGFNIPRHIIVNKVNERSLEERLEKVLKCFEAFMDRGELAYACDGIVVGINDSELFYDLGKNGNTWNGNFALKMGKYWQSNVYCSTIKEIVFNPGKRYFTPKAIIEPVLTANGSTVSNVPLYNVGVMENFEYFPGNNIYFKYGGETGVTLCDAFGNSVKGR